MAGKQRWRSILIVAHLLTVYFANRGEKEHRPKPRYTIPGTPTSQGTLSEMSFSDTMSIRQAVYEEWRKEKMKSARREKKEQELKKQEEEKKKEELKRRPYAYYLLVFLEHMISKVI